MAKGRAAEKHRRGLGTAWTGIRARQRRGRCPEERLLVHEAATLAEDGGVRGQSRQELLRVGVSKDVYVETCVTRRWRSSRNEWTYSVSRRHLPRSVCSAGALSSAYCAVNVSPPYLRGYERLELYGDTPHTLPKRPANTLHTATMEWARATHAPRAPPSYRMSNALCALHIITCKRSNTA